VKLSRVNPGFDVDRLLTFNVALTDARYAAPGVRTAFVSDFLGRLTAAPFIERAAVTSILPFSGRRGANSIEIEGHPAQPGVSLIADQRHVSTDYFRTMNIPLAAGRAFAATDDARGEQVAVINRTMARRFWNGGNPIGRRVRTAAGFDSGVWFRIVGVVDDVRHVSLSRDPVAEMYRPILQTATPMFTVVVRTTRDPAVSVPTVRSTVQAIDANLPIYDVRPMTDRVAATFAQTRGAMALLSVSAILASLLAGVAIYGSIWYSVSHRIPEIGVRLALGASRRSVFGDVLRRAVALSAVGAVFGIVGAIAGGRLMAGLLFDTRPTDPLTLLGVAAMAILVAVAAALRPAHRAMRVDPAIALRGD